MGIRGDHNCKVLYQRCTWKTNCKTRSQAKSLSAHQSDYSFSLVSLKQTKPQSPDIMHVQELVHPTVIQLCQYTYTVTTVDESVKQHARTKRESTTGLTDDPIILTMGDLGNPTAD